jgi:hypothetical protein
MVLDYSNLPEASEGVDLQVRMRMVWSGLHSADLQHYENWIYGIRFESDGELIRTVFESGFGLQGAIVSEGLEVELVQVDPPPIEEDEQHWLGIRVSTSRS